jgi:hypothetical protein
MDAGGRQVTKDWWDDVPLWHAEMAFLTDLVGSVPWNGGPFLEIFERHGMASDDIMALFRKLKTAAEETYE